jgi:hypothetical protein
MSIQLLRYKLYNFFIILKVTPVKGDVILGITMKTNLKKLLYLKAKNIGNE